MVPEKTPSPRIQTIHAILLVIMGYCAYSVADLCSKIMQEYYSIYQVLGMPSLIALVLITGWLWIGYGRRAFLPDRLHLHVTRGFFVLGSAFCMVSALRTLPLADFYGIVFIMPFLVMILAVFMLKENVGWRRWAAAAAGFSGILVLAAPQFNNIGEGVAFTFVGATFAALNVIWLRKIGSGGPTPLYGFYPTLMITVFNLSILFATNSFIPYQPEHLVYLFVHGFVVVLGIIYLSKGFSMAPETAVVAPFHYTQIVWGVLFGWMFYHVMPTPTTWAGIGIIITAGLYSIWREYKTSHSA